MQSPDMFWHLTSTAWTAIGSIVSGASVIALVIFNWRFIHFAREQADASIEQARIAKESLEKLAEQMSSDLAMQRHAVIAVLREAMNNIQFWFAHFRTEFRSEADPIQLVPSDWNNLVAYVSRHLPDSASLAAKASQGMRNVEGTLNRLVRVPNNQRGPNSSLGAGFESLGTNLDNLRKLLSDLNTVIGKEVIHTHPGQTS